MRLRFRDQRDDRRAARPRAARPSGVPGRALLLTVAAGLSGVVAAMWWTSAANASSGAGVSTPASMTTAAPATADGGSAAELLPITAPLNVVPVIMSEQAAPAQSSQLESTVDTAGDIDADALAGAVDTEAEHIGTIVTGSADTVTRNTSGLDDDPLLSVVADTVAETPDRGYGNGADPRPPISYATSGLTGAVTDPVHGEYIGTRPQAVPDARPVDLLLAYSVPMPDTQQRGVLPWSTPLVPELPGMLPRTDAVSGAVRLPPGRVGVDRARGAATGPTAGAIGMLPRDVSAEHDDGRLTEHRTDSTTESRMIIDAGGEHDRPRGITVGIEQGIVGTGGTTSGGSAPGGFAPQHDSGTGIVTPIHSPGDTEVSRVAPVTSTAGGVHQFVADPAVSPD